ncbi:MULTISPECIES: alpha-ketoglutarate-dependent dioxygenase AlkB [unclassified Variovorax]|uniref:alpha-ketoglutarate-dependent dioxygenase AlkB n=1 Tax=unclassified Variovorax TaxID=663243 RepID=UPI00076C2AF6|nr:MULTISPECIES: alpha-ketoglutarate-dependent dioxygenase AlkB [unclassified Variovorax]KWT98489.1 putative alkylated DNA repair protein [Variovorax sp. WDL1]PNG49836.1 hypothetical protein CHC06_05417 [Variovorax sp. B2]PNG50708.1 hypothetical protein CHC07_05322 [Variovorax sp. B4]VTU42399.1 hypothetical protein H6P1_00176 [Variovorax sp. PBL-H6]VTU43979.1 hypothetical protein SRS16P1_00726 [Variovorax sp. SRS16]
MNAPITYIPGFLKDPDAVLNALWNELAWERRGTTPRREYYSNEHPVPYAYGVEEFKREYQPQPWHPVVLDIKAALEERTNTKFEVCFLNGYEDQRDHLGWHGDNSSEMDDARPIGIVTVGAERDIMFRRRGDKESIERLKLQHGSLCLMAPGMQDLWDHKIPKAGFSCGTRISLTFRGYVA